MVEVVRAVGVMMEGGDERSLARKEGGETSVDWAKKLGRSFFEGSTGVLESCSPLSKKNRRHGDVTDEQPISSDSETRGEGWRIRFKDCVRKSPIAVDGGIVHCRGCTVHGR